MRQERKEEEEEEEVRGLWRGRRRKRCRYLHLCRHSPLNSQPIEEGRRRGKEEEKVRGRRRRRRRRRKVYSELTQ